MECLPTSIADNLNDSSLLRSETASIWAVLYGYVRNSLSGSEREGIGMRLGRVLMEEAVSLLMWRMVEHEKGFELLPRKSATKMPILVAPTLYGQITAQLMHHLEFISHSDLEAAGDANLVHPRLQCANSANGGVGKPIKGPCPGQMMTK